MAFTSHIAASLRHSEHRIVLTGASGWLGRATLELLYHALGITFKDRVLCFGSRVAQIQLSDNLRISQRPMRELETLSCQPTFLLHCAFLTKDRAEKMSEAEYCAANRSIRAQALDAMDAIGVDAAFLASSGAAKFAQDELATPAMRLYGALKQEDEVAFSKWASDQRKNLVIARIFNISGPHINKLNSYALSSFIVDALAGGPIVVNARQPVWRGYVAIRELMSLVFALLIQQSEKVTRFESGGDAVELGNLASRIAARLDCKVQCFEDRIGPANTYLGNNTAYRAMLDRYAIDQVSLSEQIEETIDYLKHSMAHEKPQDSYA